ncbi:MAG: arginine--tRNA ligase [SAR202 cluster bacterium]|nr:arginine--tRNA ligase [SAR202 cluster bacterium]
MLIRDIIAQRLAEAVEEAQRQAILPSAAMPVVPIERPVNPEHGDFASSLPLRLARVARMAPLEIANRLQPLVKTDGVIEAVEVAPPGFLNFRVTSRWLQQQAVDAVKAGAAYGNTDTGKGKRVQVEFVSVNPTGPVHVGHARGAVLGSALANALAAAGFEVTREYYINDAGTQMRLFAESLYVRYAQAAGSDEQLPEGGYRGAYVTELGQELARRHGDQFLRMDRAAAVSEMLRIGLDYMIANIRDDLASVGVRFDVWFSERSLFDSKQVDAAMRMLRDRGYTAEREGALWFTSSLLGEDKDNVLVRGTGQPTYFASDIAYHYNKFAARQFDRVIDIWGADHQGHVPRMKAVVGALGIDPDRLTIIISQLVTLKRGGEVVRASKRTGELVTLRELVDEVGADACRFFFLARSAEAQMEFDLELAKKQSAENPVYYVQYAHARIAGILRQAAERGVTWADGDVSLLTHEAELALLRKMAMLPEIVDGIAVTLGPQALPHYALELANAFHWFYDHCRVLPSDDGSLPLAVTKARLRLCEASKTVLARTLDLMGMSTPEKM